jgi:hypothetical protein
MKVNPENFGSTAEGPHAGCIMPFASSKRALAVIAAVF